MGRSDTRGVRRRTAVAALALVCSWGAPETETRADERAAPVRLAVLPVLVTGEHALSISEVFAAVDAAGNLRPGLRIMSIDDYYFNEGGELATRFLTCGRDAACMATQLAPFKAELGLIVVINLEVSPPLLSLLLLRTQDRAVVDDSQQELASPHELLGAITRRAEEMFDRAGHAKAGKLVIETAPKSAKIAVSPANLPDVGAPNVFTLLPGEYDVHAVQEGFDDARAKTSVKSGQTTTLRLELAEQKSLLESPWFWIGSAAAVGAVAATVSIFALRDTRRCVCVLTADGRSCEVCQ